MSGISDQKIIPQGRLESAFYRYNYCRDKSRSAIVVFTQAPVPLFLKYQAAFRHA